MGKLFDSLEDVDVEGDKYTSELPLGPEGLMHGQLKNGLTYYVRSCAKPKDRTALGLVVKVGSVAEEDSEQGVAHIVEHLAFNATDKYSNHEIVKFLEAVGAQFGACQNAYTSADETVYQLVVPSVGGATKLVGDALDVLAQFAFNIRCAPGDLSKERGAVLEEWRMARDAAGRAQEAHWRLIMQGSRYADRLPIGKETVIRNVTADTVRAFYERWYRPQNMAIVVVGDFPDTGAVVELLRGAFESGASRDTTPARSLQAFPYAPHDTPRVQVMVDKEAAESSVFVSFKQRRRPLATPAQFMDHLEAWVLQEVINSRLFALSRGTDPPFASAAVGDESLTATTGSLVLSAVAMEGAVARSLEALLTEVARIRCHGITPRQLAQALSSLKADVENTYLERDQSYCWELRDEYVRHFLNAEFVTGQEYEARLSKTLLPRVTCEAVVARAAEFALSASCVVKVVEHAKHVSEADLNAVLQRVAAAEAAGTIPPWDGDAELPDTLLPVLPEPPAEPWVVSERVFKELGATELQLSNGMRVCIKPTTFMEDEVLVTGAAFGGLSEVPRELFYTASCAAVIAGQLGVFGFKPHVLNDFLAGSRVELDIAEGAYSRSFKGVQSPADLETAMQLIHLLFTTNVRVDAAEMEVVSRLLRQSVEAQARNPLSHYHNRVRDVNYGSCYYFRPLSLEDVDAVDAHMAVAHHNLNYKNPAEFTVVFTGNVDRESLLPLVGRYLASLPATGIPPPRPPTATTPLPVSFPETPLVEDVKVAMISPITQAQVTLPITLPRSTARQELVWLGFICRLLETRLLQQMRFKFGEIYTVSVSPFFGCEPPSNSGDARGEVSISFTCDPKNRARLISLTLEEVEALQAGGARDDEIATAMRLEALAHEESEAENSYWHEVMVMGYQSKSYQECKDLDVVYRRNVEARAAVLAIISPATLAAAMQRLLPHPTRSRYTALSMVPRPPSLLQRAVTGLVTLFTDPLSLFRSTPAAGAQAAAARLGSGALEGDEWEEVDGTGVSSPALLSPGGGGPHTSSLGRASSTHMPLPIPVTRTGTGYVRSPGTERTQRVALLAGAVVITGALAMGLMVYRGKSSHTNDSTTKSSTGSSGTEQAGAGSGSASSK